MPDCCLFVVNICQIWQQKEIDYFRICVGERGTEYILGSFIRWQILRTGNFDDGFYTKLLLNNRLDGNECYANYLNDILRVFGQKQNNLFN